MGAKRPSNNWRLNRYTAFHIESQLVILDHQVLNRRQAIHGAYRTVADSEVVGKKGSARTNQLRSRVIAANRLAFNSWPENITL